MLSTCKYVYTGVFGLGYAYVSAHALHTNLQVSIMIYMMEGTAQNAQKGEITQL